jgi:23S rRNA (guanine2445-N2)-methyltransferase / 23S rRNA (guanine2069-N7)-methyltransferase
MIKHSFFATSPKNMEALLADELRELGCEDAAEARAGVHFSGSLRLAYRACLWSRVANRILLVLAKFPAASPEALYAGVKSVSWPDQFSVDDTFAVSFNTSQSQITHSQYGALKVKDAIVDQFRDQCGSRPSVQTDSPDISINVYLRRDEATLCLDLSGESLHKRGYRDQGVPAPLKENLAAAILLRAGWPQIAREGGPLVDLMCGSGTLPIEAACIAADIAPGLRRDHWGFLRWKQHDGTAWQTLLDEARERRNQGLSRLPPIYGYDNHPAAVRAAQANVEQAGLDDRITIEQRGLAYACATDNQNKGLVVANPPYGERLGEESELPELYALLGQQLKQHFVGWHGAVFTGNPDLGKKLGIRAKRMHTLFNGRIECKLLHFDIGPESFVHERRIPRPLTAEERSDGATMFANRLTKNLKHLKSWLKRERVHCYRLYDSDLPEYAVAVDIYEGEQRWVQVQEYEPPKSIDPGKARRRLREALGVILDVLTIPEEQLFLKVRRQQKGRDQYEKLDDKKHFHEVMENDCRLLVNFEDYLDTGLFLDHRLTRKMIKEMATDKDFLNLFAYTGTASVYAALGGATSTTTVDMSKTYLDWAQRNMALNNCVGKQHRFIQADCIEWLNQQKHQKKYGLIFLDPPSFSTSKRMQSTFDVQRDHVDLIRKAARLLTRDGVLIFSNNLRHFKMDKAALTNFHTEDITRPTLPKDYARNPRIHNCWKISQ